MNARQKAKKYKRLYEDLMKRPIEFCVEPHKIDTLRVERVYPEELIANTYFAQKEVTEIDFIQPKKLCMKNVTDFISAIATPNATGYVLKDIAFGLAEGLNKYIVYRINYDPEMNVYHICGEIKVVNR